MTERVQIELLQPKVFHTHLMLPKGSRHEAWIDEDGRAQLYKYPSTKIEPRFFKLVIPEDVYDKLLG